MPGRKSLYLSVAILCTCAVVTFGARMRPGGDPADKTRYIWADPFDNWSDEDFNAGRLWRGGPWPAGSASGTVPGEHGCGATPRSYWLQEYYRGNLSPDNDCTDLNLPFPLFQSHPISIVDPNCGLSGETMSTQAMAMQIDSAWQPGYPWVTPLGMSSYDLAANRLGANWTARAWDTAGGDAVDGTDEHPLTLIFYLSDKGSAANQRSLFDNSYVELNLDGDHAPTDYIWRGDNDPAHETSPEYCPQGPYPIICQQVREVNGSVSEDSTDLAYLNDHCPSLVPAFDPLTGQGKTWKSIAFGFLAIGDKDPCGVAEQGVDAHKPTKDHMMLFDGNKWRELRNARGTALTQCPPTWGTLGPEAQMADSGSGACGNFSLGGGDNKVYLKLTSTRILIHHQNGAGVDYCGAFPRVYTGPFNRISFGVAAGCQLKDKAAFGDEYACDPTGTPKQCIRYSKSFAGYDRTQVDSALLLDGVVVNSPNFGACCVHTGPSAGTCTDGVMSSECTGTWHGAGSLCSQYQCCPTPFADADHDGDVDQDDFGTFQICYNGESAAPTGCECFDRNDDGKINTTDFTSFNFCWTGPNVPWSAGITASCVP